MERLFFASRAELLAALIPEGRAVALAEPTDPRLTAAVLAAGRRYVDLGRDAAMRLSADGWDWALEQPHIAAIWVLDPDWPCCTRLPAALARRARDAGMTLVVEAPEPRRALVQAETLRVYPAGGGLVVSGPPELILPLRRAGRPAPSGLPRASMASPERLSAAVGAVAAQGFPVIGAHPSVGVAFRNPGVPSAVSARRLGLSDAGSAHWTWRDLVYLAPAVLHRDDLAERLAQLRAERP